ncbi:hypothetical protein T440DRAFT_260526 [Plenodomus tracheiphilus IPT5]|uniref:Uncharacterized protein n=1 Tax=Plenodomus tracheiphilus IPT5 TaxID=1408161 RepID=A0A6A7AT69_9PLEO|nr:hypothetical protein T440DRAFT_260526 [Plenodomus tracheiphilus IPT5]
MRHSARVNARIRYSKIATCQVWYSRKRSMRLSVECQQQRVLFQIAYCRRYYSAVGYQPVLLFPLPRWSYPSLGVRRAAM